eukprot:15465390-Alexandrium_andersonii.AAC.1
MESTSGRKCRMVFMIASLEGRPMPAAKSGWPSEDDASWSRECRCGMPPRAASCAARPSKSPWGSSSGGRRAAGRAAAAPSTGEAQGLGVGQGVKAGEPASERAMAVTTAGARSSPCTDAS